MKKELVSLGVIIQYEDASKSVHWSAPQPEIPVVEEENSSVIDELIDPLINPANIETIWNGLWKTDLGMLEITVIGDKLNGIFNDGKTITGTIQNGELVGTYDFGSGGKGGLTFKISDNGLNLIGNYGKLSESKLKWRTWNASKETEEND